MESRLKTKNGTYFKIVKEPNDPITNRLSIGGDLQRGCYVVYRGNSEDCIQVLKEAIEALEQANKHLITQGN